MNVNVKNTFGKILIAPLVLFLVALGLLGLLFPIIPGLLFLLFAAMIAARHFPALAFVLNRNRHTAECMRISNSFFNLDIWDRIRLCFWGSLKFILNSIEWTMNFLEQQVRKLLRS